MTVREAEERWLESLVQKKTNAIQTITTYKNRLSMFHIYNIPNMDVCELDKKIYDKAIMYLIDKDYNASTVISANDTFKTFCNWMLKHNYITSVPYQDTRIPEKDKFEPYILTEKEIQYMISKAKYTEMYLPIWLAYKTGLRRGQVLALQWGNIDWDNNRIYIDKNLIRCKTRTFSSGKEHKARWIPMDEDLRTELFNELEHRIRHFASPPNRAEEYICLTATRKGFEPSYFNKCFRKFMNSIGMSKEIRFHDLRWTYINREVRIRGPKEVAELVGHHSAVYCLDYYYKTNHECA